MSKKLVKSGIIVSFMTFISRILGLARDVVIANLMGAGGAADVFLLANKIPNFLRRLFAEGAFAQAFVPVLTEVKNGQSIDETRLFIARISGTLGTIVSIITIIAVIASPFVAGLFASGWFIEWWNGEESGERFELAATLLKITFPYLWFISLTALSGAILNTWGRFGVASFTPVFLNISIIACAIWLSPHVAEPAYALAWGVFIGGLVQLLFQLPFLYKQGLLVRPRWGWNDSNVQKVKVLMIPALFGVSVSQINLLLDTVIASFLGDGPIAWLYYSDRLLEFPLGLFGIAIATVVLPALSQKHVDKSTEQFAGTMDWGVRMVVFLGIPASAGLIVLAEPMIMALFMRGEFTASDVSYSGASLMAYGSGLLSFMLIKVLAPGFYARQDTKTPVKYGIWAMVANMVFNLALVFPFGYVGLAMATAMSATLNVGLLYYGLRKQQVYQFSTMTWFFIARVAVSVAVMTVLIIYYLPAFDTWLEFTIWQKSLNLGGLILGGGVVYLLSFFVLGGRIRHFKASPQPVQSI